MENKNVLKIITGVVMLLLITVGVSYAYFTAELSGGEDDTTLTIGGGSLNINFNGGSNINIANIFPGNTPAATKVFTLTGNNTTDLTMPYTIKLIVDSNTFSGNALSYKLTSTNTSNNGTIVPSITANQNITTGTGNYTLGSGTFKEGTGKVHTYALSIYFLDQTEVDQNDDQGATFKAHIGIEAGEAKVPTAAKNVIALASDSVTTGVYNEPATDYRYEGLNVNNYVSFNNELWRIIGVFADNTHNRSGEQLVKIMRDEVITSTPWDSGNVNNWETSSLKNYLNGEYYNTIDSSYQSMIENVTWRLGGWNSASVTTAVMYGHERGTTVYSGRPVSGEGKIGLMYPSDYGYSVLASFCVRTKTLFTYDTSGCYNQSWIYKASTYQWTLTPNSGSSLIVSYVSGNGFLHNNVATNGFGVRSTLYLKSSVKFSSGDGSQGNPYTLS